MVEAGGRVSDAAVLARFVPARQFQAIGDNPTPAGGGEDFYDGIFVRIFRCYFFVGHFYLLFCVGKSCRK
jgi:hypothetical protein